MADGADGTGVHGGASREADARVCSGDDEFAALVACFEQIKELLARVQADSAQEAHGRDGAAVSIGLMPPLPPARSTSTLELEEMLSKARGHLSTLGGIAAAAHGALRTARAGADAQTRMACTHTLDRAELRVQRGESMLAAFHLTLAPHVVHNWVLSLEELL